MPRYGIIDQKDEIVTREMLEEALSRTAEWPPRLPEVGEFYISVEDIHAGRFLGPIPRLNRAMDDPHPEYGQCDAFGPQETCSECTGLVERDDGSVIRKDDHVVVRKPTLMSRLVRAWDALCYRDPDERGPF